MDPKEQRGRDKRNQALATAILAVTALGLIAMIAALAWIPWPAPEIAVDRNVTVGISRPAPSGEFETPSRDQQRDGPRKVD